MTILEFALLRGGCTPAELGLPDSVLDGAAGLPLAGVTARCEPPLFFASFSDTNRKEYMRAYYQRTKPARKLAGGDS